MKKFLLGLVMAVALTACAQQPAPAPTDAKGPMCESCCKDMKDGKITASIKERCCKKQEDGTMAGMDCPCCKSLMKDGKMMCPKESAKKTTKTVTKKTTEKPVEDTKAVKKDTK